MDPLIHHSLTNGENFPVRYKVVADESFENIVILDGVPIIDNSRREKLLAKISKEFAKRGSAISPNDITFPWDDDVGKSKGCVYIPVVDAYSDPQFTRYIFMEFKTREDAEYAINTMNNVPFDSKHTFRLNHFLDAEKYTELDPTYVEPELEAYKPGVRD
jgi:translation initiation factor 3 subunit B